MRKNIAQYRYLGGFNDFPGTSWMISARQDAFRQCHRETVCDLERTEEKLGTQGGSNSLFEHRPLARHQQPAQPLSLLQIRSETASWHYLPRAFNWPPS